MTVHSLTTWNMELLSFLANRLYWTDLFKNSIKSSDLDGGHHLVLAYDNGAILHDVTIHGRYIFYTGWQRQ